MHGVSREKAGRHGLAAIEQARADYGLGLITRHNQNNWGILPRL
jgi:hypothetical protein